LPPPRCYSDNGELVAY